MASTKVVINFAPELTMHSILRGVQRRNISGLQWIASESWATARTLRGEFGDLLSGTIGFAIRNPDVIPGLKEHLTSFGPSLIDKSPWLADFWEEIFNCRLNRTDGTQSQVNNNHNRSPCKGTEDLNDVKSPYTDLTHLGVSYNVYKAVYLVAHALQEMSDCTVGRGPLPDGACPDPKNFKPWQVRKKTNEIEEITTVNA